MKTICPICRSSIRSIWKERRLSAYRCESCATIHISPPPLHSSSIYGRSYFQTWYSPFEKRRKAFLRRLLDVLAPLPSGGRVLDVGCGTGFLLDLLRERGWDVQGQEISPFAVECCREKGVPVFARPLTEFPEADGSFDLITIVDVLAHVEDPAAYLRVCRRLLKPGGLLVVKTPWHPDALFCLASFFRWSGKGRVLLHVPAQIFHWDRRSLSRVLRMNGFVVRDIVLVPEPTISFPRGRNAFIAWVIKKKLAAMGWDRAVVCVAVKPAVSML